MLSSSSSGNATCAILRTEAARFHGFRSTSLRYPEGISHFNFFQRARRDFADVVFGLESDTKLCELRVRLEIYNDM